MSVLTLHQAEVALSGNQSEAETGRETLAWKVQTSSRHFVNLFVSEPPRLLSVPRMNRWSVFKTAHGNFICTLQCSSPAEGVFAVVASFWRRILCQTLRWCRNWYFQKQNKTKKSIVPICSVSMYSHLLVSEIRKCSCSLPNMGDPTKCQFYQESTALAAKGGSICRFYGENRFFYQVSTCLVMNSLHS